VRQRRSKTAKSSQPPKTADWSQLLVQAVNTPGVLSDAYQRFWNYSIGNQLMALFECLARGLNPGPIHTFKGWLDLGRYVKKGEKAITLCMPVSVKAKKKEAKPDGEEKPEGDADDATGRRTIFVFRPNWFVLCQTDGAPYVPTELPEWSETRALAALLIERVDFQHPDGNCQGYAQRRCVAVSPIAALPHKTLFHELGHVVLEHTTEGMLDDHERTPRSLREVEAECVALICCEALALPGIPECRGYVQHWLKTGNESSPAIPERSAQRIFKAADAILKAGRPAPPDKESGES
jgi:antirestriction protein ArdC